MRRMTSPVSGRLLWVVAVSALTSLVLLSVTVETAVRPPKFDYELHTLDNGLTVVLAEDHSTPIVRS
ncbi:MAG: hypothetical protein OSB03_11015, partial [Vicinamibacterales bacterium]|nr:hypothetical protein [Vicinamibacterales bacterium]